MRFLKHLKKLIKEFLAFAGENKAWWIIPIIIVLLLLAFLVTVTTGAAPFIYTTF